MIAILFIVSNGTINRKTRMETKGEMPGGIIKCGETNASGA